MPEIHVNKERLRDLVLSKWALATDVAGALVREKGLSWRIAHQIIGILVRYSYERGFKVTDVTPQLIDEAAVEYWGKPVNLSQEALKKALDPLDFVKRRTLLGGPAPEESKMRLSTFRTRLHSDESSVADKERRIQEAKMRLEATIDSLIK